MDTLSRMWDEGASGREIASTLGISLSKVYRLARERGLERRRRLYTDEERETLKRMWTEGAAMGQICEAIGHTPSSVRTHISTHRSDYPYRSMRVSSDEAEEMRRMADAGHSAWAVAKHFGVHPDTVRRRL